jgi:hypothetical protein
MQLSFLPAELKRWTDTGCDALVLTFFHDERPLRGAAGLTDWRLAGRLSRLLKASRLTGKRGDTLMMPAGGRIPFERVFLFGLGRGGNLDEAAFRTHARGISDVLARAGVHHYAVQPPGRATGLIAARKAATLWLDEMDDSTERLLLIDSPGAQREMGDILARAS